MTIQIPPENLLDRVLKLFGKERLVVIAPATVRLCNELGPHVQVMARRESFVTALLRFQRSIDPDKETDLLPQQSAP